MFNSSKKKPTSINDTTDQVNKDFVTHNMPGAHRFSGQTFSSGTAVKNNSSLNNPSAVNHQKVGLLIIGGGFILIILLFYFGYSYFIKPLLKEPALGTNNNQVVTAPEVITSKTEEVLLPPQTIATETPLIATSTNTAATSSELFPEETPVILEPKTVSTTDSDADGLTDDEEKITGTDPNKADTDADGYLDLAELKSGYDPLSANMKATTTSQMLSYKIDDKTTVIYPSFWEITRSDINNTIIFVNSDKAFIQVTYQDNPGKISPRAWFTEQFSGLTPGEEVLGDSWQGIYSQDELAAYIFNKDFSKIYNFSCSPLTNDTDGVTLFHLMIKTLIIK